MKQEGGSRRRAGADKAKPPPAEPAQPPPPPADVEMHEDAAPAEPASGEKSQRELDAVTLEGEAREKSGSGGGGESNPEEMGGAWGREGAGPRPQVRKRRGSPEGAWLREGGGRIERSPALSLDGGFERAPRRGQPPGWWAGPN